MYDLGLYVGLFEILRDFIRLPGLYGLKYDGLIASVIAFVLVLLQIGRFYYRNDHTHYNDTFAILV